MLVDLLVRDLNAEGLVVGFRLDHVQVLAQLDEEPAEQLVAHRLLELLEKESRNRRTTKSSLVREALEKTLTARPANGEATCYDLARDLAGSLKGLPRDLATNPKYMEGFGR